MKLDSLKKLYVHELKDLHSGERQILAALPAIIAAAKNKELAQALENHRAETEVQLQRLEEIFAELDFQPGGHHCKGMEGILKEGAELLQADIEPAVLDAGIVSSCQRVEHYEMAGYGTARAYAEKLGYRLAADLLQKTLDEEAHADEILSRLAERNLNFLAMVS